MGGPLSGLAFLSAGHSNRPYADLSALLREAGASAVADVRSVPRSSRMPWFDGPALADALRGDGIAYAFLGAELGGRPARASLYRDGVADYEAMAREPSFAAGIDRLRAGASRHRVALLCSEGDPERCHRCLLVGRALREGGAAVTHLRHGRDPVGQEEVEATLLARAGAPGAGGPDLFAAPGEGLAQAYAAQARRAAHRRG